MIREFLGSDLIVCQQRHGRLYINMFEEVYNHFCLDVQWVRVPLAYLNLLSVTQHRPVPTPGAVIHNISSSIYDQITLIEIDVHLYDYSDHVTLRDPNRTILKSQL